MVPTERTQLDFGVAVRTKGFEGLGDIGIILYIEQTVRLYQFIMAILLASVSDI